MLRYQRMTNRQLKEIVADYAASLPAWRSFEGTAFVREHGPVRQTVWFEALRTGAYRPMSGIGASALPMVAMLPQMLDVRHRQATLRQHPDRKAAIMVAMEQQVRPSIHMPLDIAEILGLCEAEAREATNDFAMLAILHAWLGQRGKALSYCSRAQSCPPPTLAPIPEWETQIKTFCRSLAGAVEMGTASDFLRSAAEELRANWGAA
jgi:hypothetical protein